MVTLESSKLVTLVPAAELNKICAAARELEFSAGQQIFKEGDPGNGMYVLKDGQVEISSLMDGGRRQVLSEVLPGDVFGEMAVLDNHPRSACASAETAVRAWFIPRDSILQLLKDSPDAASNFVQEVCGRLREFNRQYLRQVLQAERLAVIGRFASSIVHDLKNPLTVIGLSAEMACAEKATQPMRQLAQEHIAKQIDRITSLVNDILDFTRGTSQPLVLTDLDYATYFKSILGGLESDAVIRRVTIDLENPAPSVQLALHPQRLSRVFHNLVGNALDAMPKGGKIKIRFQVTAEHVQTEIQDSGRGIPSQIAERLFEPFATFGKEKGTGLGLSICRKIIEEHGGTIFARNHPAGGAVFSFTLPRPPG